MIAFYTGEDSLQRNQELEKSCRNFLGDLYNDPFSRILVFADDNSQDEPPIERILKNFQIQSMFAEKKAIIVKNANKLSPTEQNELAANLVSLDDLTALFIEAPKLDGRMDLVKGLKKFGTIFKFEKPKDYQIPDWIIKKCAEHGFSISKDVALYFQEVSGNDTNVLDAEIQKLRIYDKEADRIGIEILDAVVSNQNTGNIFDLQNFFGLRNAPKFTKALNQLLNNNEHPILITTTLYNHAVKLFRVQYRLSLRQTPDQIAKELGIHPFVFKKNQLGNQAQKASPERLRRVIIRLTEIEAGLKTGLYSEKAEFQLATLAMV
jgi:DNA polymerase-3 subunit delta